MNIYIGPIELIVNFKAEAYSLPETIFQRKTSFIHSTYRVNIIDKEVIQEEGTIAHKNEGVKIFYSEGIEHRYYQYPFQDKYYAHSYRVNNDIYVEFAKDSIRKILTANKLWGYIFLEQLLLENNAFIVHSSSVIKENKALLFSAPSGTGKSTQANLWRDYFDDVMVMNGDRNILCYQNGTWMACSLPWHGSSNDCLSTESPLMCIVELGQSTENEVKEVMDGKKYQFLYKEITVNIWNSEFVDKILVLLEKLFSDVSIISYECTKDVDAVSTLYSYLWG